MKVVKHMWCNIYGKITLLCLVIGEILGGIFDVYPGIENYLQLPICIIFVIMVVCFCKYLYTTKEERKTRKKIRKAENNRKLEIKLAELNRRNVELAEKRLREKEIKDKIEEMIRIEKEKDNNPIYVQLLYIRDIYGEDTTKHFKMAVGGLLGGYMGAIHGACSSDFKNKGTFATFTICYESGRKEIETVEIGSDRFWKLYTVTTSCVNQC